MSEKKRVPIEDTGDPVDFYEVELRPGQLKALKDAMDRIVPAGGLMTYNMLRSIREALTNARPMANELPPASLPWGEVTAEARRQGVSEVDVIYDLAGREVSDADESAS